MRLTCPRCEAQYEIPESAIPAAGREVECSACSQVWFQPGPDSPQSAGEGASRADYDPDARPALNQPLHESILSILREETARELSARRSGPRTDAETGAPGDGDHIAATGTDPDLAGGFRRGGPSQLPDPRDIEWPVATVILPGEPLPRPEPAATEQPIPDADAAPLVVDEPVPQPEPQPEPEAPTPPASDPEPERVAPALPDAARLAATLLRHKQDEDDKDAALDESDGGAPIVTAPMLSRPAPAEAKPAPVPAVIEPREVALVSPQSALAELNEGKPRSGYAKGFGLALVLALALLAFYALAGAFSTVGDGSFLAESRAAMDQGRLWLADRVGALLSGGTGE
ncbi:zinc-ribbon domain-containing protein [Paracoccus sp. CPCC 101403]|uniref:Zinc-ribbon domain-containing protein n=1 Tax=Paracoccus broussonetiae TaxID=3075834 RepID=A0ABU3E7Z4_9RHOB|nr:zinc-ribbon domain-containing protein [Paracoccus sp. CPCC 101403]MDT1060276.1 zinc-ribbon domain-containing protein [Paracoccus sp. CPCC 101403]